MAKLARRGFLKRTTASIATVGVFASIPAALTAMSDAPQITEIVQTDVSSLALADDLWWRTSAISPRARSLSPVRHEGKRLN